MNSPVSAIVPMKPVAQGKSRLSPVLDSEGRSALSLLLLDHVLGSLSRASPVLDRQVVGGDAPVQALALQWGAAWRPDPGGGLNAALTQALDTAYAAGAPAVLILPGDLGRLAPADVEDIVTTSRGLTRIVIARAYTDGGTNALLMPRPLAIQPSFGPKSFARHLELARLAAIPVAAVTSPGLGFDLDTPLDLAGYGQSHSHFDERLERWRDWLRAFLVNNR